MEYEICYLIGETKEIDLEKIRKEVEKSIEKNEGKLIEGEFVIKRRLAYQIKNEARGTYVAKRFSLPGKDERDERKIESNLVEKITKEVKFNPNILRFIIVKTDDLLSFDELESAGKDAKDDRKGKNKDMSVRAASADRKPAERVAAPVEDVKKEAPAKEEKSEAEEKPAKEKSDSVKEEPKKKKKADPSSDEASSKKEDKDDISEDNIDAKLDEILNI